MSKRVIVLAVLVAVALPGCAVRECLRNPLSCGIGDPIPQTSPSPSPSVEPSQPPPTTLPPASPEPSASPMLCTQEVIDMCAPDACKERPGLPPQCVPVPSPVPPSPKPPTPSPSPCVTDPPETCVQINPECESCAKWISDRLRSEDLTRHPNGLVYNDPGGNPAGREWFDPKTCFMVHADGSLRNKRLQKSGEVCEKCEAPAPKPCPTPSSSPSPGATPQPGPTPGTCPVLVRWGGGLHAQMNPQHQGLPKEPTFAGNTIDFDSTARFGNGGRGLPCNDEHHAVCEKDGIDDGPNWRRCEDPRGPIFTVTRGGGWRVKAINGGWGLRIEGVHAGTVCVRIEPRPDVQDALGMPVRVGPNPATEVCVNVQ